MSSTRTLLILSTYISIFLLSFLSSPSTKSILTPQIQCLKSSDPLHRKCAYCWTRPTNLHPTNQLTLDFPVMNSHLISTKSCQNFTCQQSLQLFTESEKDVLDNSTEAQKFLANTDSKIQPAPSSITIPQQYHSWRILINVPTNMILPTSQSFWYTNNNGITYYRIVEGLVLAVTFTIIIATTLCNKNSYGRESKMGNWLVTIVGMVSVGLLYLEYNFVASVADGIVLSGAGKGLLLYYIINTVPALKDYYPLSLGSFITLISISFYQSLISSPTFLSNITLFLTLTILTTLSFLLKRQNWSLQLLTILSLLYLFTIGDWILMEGGENNVWRVLRMVSVGLVVSLAHVTGLGVVEFEAVEGRPYWPSQEREGEMIVEVEQTTII